MERSPGSRAGLACADVEAVGYTFIESTEMSSALSKPATQTAMAAFPEAV